MTNTPDEITTPGATASTFPEERRLALAAALKERFGMSADDSDEIASTMAEVFAGETEVNDEELDPSIRSIFYTLEAKKLLTFRRYEYTIETGEHRRGFAWRIREEALTPATTLVPIDAEEDVYANLPRDVWARQHA